MVSFVTTRRSKGKNARKPTGIIQLNAKSTAPKFLRSSDNFFWYTSSDGIIRLATSSDTGKVPEQINDYDFDPLLFRKQRYPSTFPKGGVWPPKKVEDILCPVGSINVECVGDECYTNTICEDPECGHTFENWIVQTQNWQDHFELVRTEDRGIGVYTKKAFYEGDVLGWYAGELKTVDGCLESDYIMEMDIGEIPDSEDPECTVFIDAAKKGNWTRFINHSCDPHCIFRIRRVGNVRIMAVEATRDIEKGVELSVGYGEDYYGLETKKICHCGAKDCIGKKRKELDEKKTKKVRVKKCKRMSPPLE